MPTAVPPFHNNHNNHNSDNESDNGSEGHPDPMHEEYVEFSPEGSPSLLPLQPDDFPTYFSERDGRLFHSSTTSPYPLPIDASEQERLKALHAFAKILIGANYVGPVPDILAHDPDRQKCVLDLCTGTGTWAMEMAEEFPHVLFRGMDIVPIATRYPLPNVVFEIDDITAGFRWPDATFDFIHARDISLSIHEYPTIFPEVVRVLRPGGLLLSCEWEREILFHPDRAEASDHALHAPASASFYQVLNAALGNQGIQTVISQIPSYLHGTEAFHGITSSLIYVPVGIWPEDLAMRELGRGFLALQSRYAENMKPLLLQIGHSQEFVDELVRNFVEELRTKEGLVGTYRLVYGIRN